MNMNPITNTRWGVPYLWYAVSDLIANEALDRTEWHKRIHVANPCSRNKAWLSWVELSWIFYNLYNTLIALVGCSFQEPYYNWVSCFPDINFHRKHLGSAIQCSKAHHCGVSSKFKSKQCFWVHHEYKELSWCVSFYWRWKKIHIIIALRLFEGYFLCDGTLCKAYDLLTWNWFPK